MERLVSEVGYNYDQNLKHALGLSDLGDHSKELGNDHLCQVAGEKNGKTIHVANWKKKNAVNEYGAPNRFQGHMFYVRASCH